MVRTSFLYLLSLLVVACACAPSPGSKLNVTVSAAKNGVSTIECWSLDPPFASTSQAGIQGGVATSLGLLANGSYSIVPGGSNGGLHSAPSVQYVIFLTGAADISIPSTGQKASISAGKNGLFMAVDTANVSKQGHVTVFTKDTILLQIPTEGGVVPPHKVLYQGGCKAAELVK